MSIRIAVSIFACLIAVLPGAPALAGDDPPGVPVFHDRVVKRDRAGDVKGDRSTPIDVRRVQYDHYKTGDNERLVITALFGKRVRKGSEIRWSSSAGAGGDFVELTATVGGPLRLERDYRKVRHPKIRRDVEGRTVEITIPWRKLGSPAVLDDLSFFASLIKPPEWSGVDLANSGTVLK